eukprot:TCONS_00062977-protein
MGYEGDDDKYHRRKHTRWISGATCSKLFITSLFCFGVYLVISNSYGLYVRFTNNYGKSFAKSLPQKNAWIYAKHNYHLKVIFHILTQAGYHCITSTKEPPQWDLLWAHDFPFRKEFHSSLSNLQQNQKVNKLPGTSSITLKVELARTKLKWIPTAFSIPAEETQFAHAATKNPDQLWVQKSNNHRGIKIISAKDINTNAGSTFVQEFIERPLLIDKKKFDIGIYVVYTSVNPLQVYYFHDEALFRFCTEDYYPLYAANTKKYVVGDDYIPLDQMPSLKKFYNHGQMSFKSSFFSYMLEKGFDPDSMWKEIRHCITELFKAKAEEMDEAFSGHHFKQNFFELVRVDFVVDEKGKVWLMEVNMSPNLSPDAHPVNRMMYTKVVRGALQLGNALTNVDERYDTILHESAARMRDITFANFKCSAAECLKCEITECQLCHHCLDDTMKMLLPKAFREHYNKGSYRRLLPIPLTSTGEPLIPKSQPKGQYNDWLSSWFQKKCKEDISWCQ